MRISTLGPALLVVATVALQGACGGDTGSSFPRSGGGSGGDAFDAGSGSSSSGEAGSFFGGSGASSGGSSGAHSGTAQSGSSSGGTVHDCMGCYDMNGQCQPGTSNTMCGTAQSTCQDCTAFGMLCSGMACGGSGPSTGSSSGSGSPRDAGGGG